MKKLFYSSIVIIILLISSCGAGNKEYFVVEYLNSGSPSINYNSMPKSLYISYDTVYADDIGSGTVQIVVNGIRVLSKTKRYKVDKINIYEEYNNKYKIQHEFGNLSTSNKTDIAVVLVLDMSTSLGDLTSDLKEYAKNFIDQIVNSTELSKVAVVFFSSQDDISNTLFYDYTNADELKLQIDEYNDYKSRTALFAATVTGINMLDTLNYPGSEAIVIFTDGGDNDSDNPETKKAKIGYSEYLRVCIGLEGEDFWKDDIKSIASSNANAIVVKDSEGLKDAFNKVALQIVSVYNVVYDRSDQELSEPLSIKFEFEIDKIQ